MPMDRSKYPPDWPVISRTVRDEAGNRCEFCGARNHEPHPVTGSKVVLTVAHMDHDPAHSKLPEYRDNLKALCQRCHLRYDAAQHAETRRRNRILKARQTMDDQEQDDVIGTDEIETDEIDGHLVTYIGSVQETPKDLTYYGTEWPRLTPKEREKIGDPDRIADAARRLIAQEIAKVLPNARRRGTPTGNVLAVADLGQLWIEMEPVQETKPRC